MLVSRQVKNYTSTRSTPHIIHGYECHSRRAASLPSASHVTIGVYRQVGRQDLLNSERKKRLRKVGWEGERSELER